MDQFRSGTRLLVQKGEMGGRTVYTALLGLREQMSLVPPRPESGSLEEREQRLTDAGHVDEIARYVGEVPDYFLPGLMAFLFDEPDFEPLKDSDGNVLTDRIGYIWVDANVGRSLGDGMHRGMGIEAAVSADIDERLKNDSIVVSFIVEKNRDRRRQLFNDVNRTQKRVPKSLGVTYDSRDPISKAVNEVVENQPLGVLIEREKGTAGRGSGKLMTSGTLYDCVSMLCYGWTGKPGRTTSRVTDTEAREAAALFVDFVTQIPDVESVLDASDPPAEADRLRARSILGSGATMKAMAGAVFVAMGRLESEDELREAFVNLADIDWDPTAWVEIGFVPSGGRTPSSRSQEVRAAGLKIADYLAPVESV